jgi:hypothetical protein
MIIVELLEPGCQPQISRSNQRSGWTPHERRLAITPARLSGSHRYCTAGYAIARPVLPRMSKLAAPLGSSHAALVLATMLINPSSNCDSRTTRSQHLTDTGSASHKAP